MSLTHLSLSFLVQLGLGSTLTFLCNDRRALDAKYFKVAGWIQVALYGLALTLVAEPALAEGATTLERVLGASVLGALACNLLFSSVSGWDRPGLETLLLWLAALTGAGAAGAAALSGLPADADDVLTGLALVAALLSAGVLGFTTYGMLLGHWYLVSQGLSIRHLAALVRPLPWILGAKLVLSGGALWWFWERFLAGQPSLAEVFARQPDRILEIVAVCSRIPVGLAIPLVLAAMAGVTVRMEKTQPATGILYAMCGLVYMGDIMGKAVEASTGIPL